MRFFKRDRYWLSGISACFFLVWLKQDFLKLVYYFRKKLILRVLKAWEFCFEQFSGLNEDFVINGAVKTLRTD